MTVNPNNNPLAYLGVVAQTPPNEIVANRSPTNADIHFPVGTQWTNEVAGSQYVLVRFVAGVPDWALSTAAAGDVTQLTPDSGGVVTPSAGNINIVGGTGIQTVGTANTITFNVVGEGEKTVVLTADQNPAATNTSYINNKTANSTLTVTFGATGYAVGDIIRLTGLTSHNTAGNYWVLQANAAGAFHDGSISGAAGGTITCSSQYGSVTVMAEAVTAGAVTDWAVIAATGTLAIA